MNSLQATSLSTQSSPGFTEAGAEQHLPGNNMALIFAKAAAFNPSLSGTDIKVGMWVVMTTIDIAFIGLLHWFSPLPLLIYILDSKLTFLSGE